MSDGPGAAVPEGVQRWVGRRPSPHSLVACAAPFVTMEFGAYGLVQACCANAMYPIGDVRTESLLEIWHGARAQGLRKSLREGALDTGCGVCRFRLLHESGELPRDYYDLFGFEGGADPSWPRILTFSLHNTCNLECVMCGGDESSRIRTRRDGLPPLPHVYGDRFFDELEPFLAHCEFADFVGGEPFLVREHQRVWDMLAAQDHRVKCSATTNGTVWNGRVERVLDRLDFQITVSVDGITAPTFESIRVGASFDEVYRNIERFRDYTRDRGTPFSISWSLVRQNWFELGTMLGWAEERGIPVKVQTVMEPAFGVQAAPTEELRNIVAALEAEDDDLRPRLQLNLDMWDRELRRLQDELRLRAHPTSGLRAMRGPEHDNAAHVMQTLLRGSAPAPAHATEWTSAHPDGFTAWIEPGRTPVSMDIDPEGTVTLTGPLEELMPGRVVPVGAGAGQTLDRLLMTLSEAFGGGLWLIEEFVEGPRIEHLLFLGRRFRDKAGLALRMISTQADDGHVHVEVTSSFSLVERGAEEPTRATYAPAAPEAVPVSLLRPRPLT